MNDARVAAWIAAWDNLNAAAESLKRNPPDEPDYYQHALQFNAEIYAALADVPHEVGAAAGELLQLRDQERREQELMFRKAFDK